jgi:flagellar biogenesis protein FliO
METRQLFSVLAVFALLGAALWVLRRRGGIRPRSSIAGSLRLPFFGRQTGPGKSLVSLQRLALTPQHSLHLVQINGRVMVVTTHPQGCALLCEEGKGPQA